MDHHERVRRFWDAESRGYDSFMVPLERYFPTSRQWVCGRASGRVLEVGIGTGLNLPHYDPDVDLVGLEYSEQMLRHAERRLSTLEMPRVTLMEGDAMALPFEDESFDSVVSTFVLCSVPSVEGAIAEMIRVLTPGGRLLLADHIVASAWYVRLAERLIELVTVPFQDEYFTRRPLLAVRDLGLEVIQTERRTRGAVENVHAVKPG